MSLKKTAVDAAKEAGSFIKRRLGKIREISFKGEINLVTDVDKKSEAIIMKRIKKDFPCHVFLAEESADTSAGNKAADYKWIIDPIDGTNNFAHSFPFFCVSIALEKNGKVVLGVVYDPIRDELFFAEENKGSYLNNKRINVSSNKNLKGSLLATGFSYNIKTIKDNNLGHFAAFVQKAQGIRRLGAAALDICYVACARLDGFWELDLHPWDTAAAYFILEQAGGKVTDFSARKYSPYYRDVVASNGLIHESMLKVIKES
ncbi:MAG: inositol monophosphatase family protein [Candidatus Omnitrophota bacterium]